MRSLSKESSPRRCSASRAPPALRPAGCRRTARRQRPRSSARTGSSRPAAPSSRRLRRLPLQPLRPACPATLTAPSLPGSTARSVVIMRGRPPKNLPDLRRNRVCRRFSQRRERQKNRSPTCGLRAQTTRYRSARTALAHWQPALPCPDSPPPARPIVPAAPPLCPAAPFSAAHARGGKGQQGNRQRGNQGCMPWLVGEYRPWKT